MANRSNNNGARAVYAPGAQALHHAYAGHVNSLYNPAVFGPGLTEHVNPEYRTPHNSLYGATRGGFVLHTELKPVMQYRLYPSHFGIRYVNGVPEPVSYFGPIIPQLVEYLPGEPNYHEQGRYDSPKLIYHNMPADKRLKDIARRIRHFEHKGILRIVNPLPATALAASVKHFANLSAAYTLAAAPLPFLLKNPEDRETDVLVKALNKKNIEEKPFDEFLDETMATRLEQSSAPLMEILHEANARNAIDPMRVATDFDRAVASVPHDVAVALRKLSDAVAAEFLFETFKCFNPSRSVPGVRLLVSDARDAVFDAIGYDNAPHASSSSLIGGLADVITELRRVDGVYLDGQDGSENPATEEENKHDLRKTYGKPDMNKVVPYEAPDNSRVAKAVQNLIKVTDYALARLDGLTKQRRAEQLVTKEMLDYMTNNYQDNK